MPQELRNVERRTEEVSEESMMILHLNNLLALNVSLEFILDVFYPKINRFDVQTIINGLSYIQNGNFNKPETSE